MLLGRDARIGAGRVDERDEREVVPIGELHHPHRLPVALRIGHAEVPRRPLLDVTPLLVPDQRDRAALELADPGHERVIVHPPAIAVQLEEVLEDPLDVVEGVRALLVAGELDPLPDLLVRGVVLEPLELALQTLELGREPRPAQQLDPAPASPTGHGGRARRRSSRGPREKPDQLRDDGTELGARHDPVDVAEAEVRLGEAEVVRQLLARGLGDDPRACERHQGAGLGDEHVAERGKAREQAARRRVREHGDHHAAGLVQLLERTDRLRQLHQRQDPLLHAGAAGGRDRDQRQPACRRVLAGARELLADDAAHRAAHEREIHHREPARKCLDPGRARDHRVPESRRHLGLGQALGVRLEVEELERVARPQRHLVLRECALVGQLGDAFAALDREVMAALRADPQVRLQLLIAVVRPAVGTRIRVLLRRPVVERCLLVLDRDIDLVGGGHQRHLRPASSNRVTGRPQRPGARGRPDRQPRPTRRPRSHHGRFADRRTRTGGDGHRRSPRGCRGAALSRGRVGAGQAVEESAREAPVNDDAQAVERRRGIAEAQMKVISDMVYNPFYAEANLDPATRARASELIVGSFVRQQQLQQGAMFSGDRIASEVYAELEAGREALNAQLEGVFSDQEMAAWNEYDAFQDQVLYEALLDGQLRMLAPGLDIDSHQKVMAVFAEELVKGIDAFNESAQTYNIENFNDAQLDALKKGVQRLQFELDAEQVGHAEGFIAVETMFEALKNQPRQ